MSRFSKYSEVYTGEVVDVKDPEKRCRARVNVFNLYDGIPSNQLPWANFDLPIGSRPGEGTSTPVRVGDIVQIRFKNGDTRYPVIVGAAQAAPNGNVNLAPEQWQGKNQYKHKRTDSQPKVEESEYNVDLVSNQNKSLIQRCEDGTIRITQMSSGSAIELRPDGDMVIHCEGKLYISVDGDVLEEIKGNFKMKVQGNFEQEAAGEFSLKANGINENSSGTFTIRGQSVFIN